MASDVIVRVGAGGDYENLAAARTALNALNLISLDQRIIVKLLEDQVLTNTASTFNNTNTDATRYIYVRPDDGLSWKEAAGGNIYYTPSAGLKIIANAGASGALSIDRGWFFDLLLIESNPSVAAISPVRLGNTSSPKYTGIARSFITGNHTLAPLLDFRDPSTTTEPSQAYLLDSVVIGSGSDNTAGMISGSGGALYRNTLIANGGAGRALRLQVPAANRGFWVIDNAIVGSWETVHTSAANLGTPASSNSRGNYLTGAYVQTGTGNTYTSESWTTGATASALFEAIASNLRPNSTSALLGGATARANNTSDINGQNRGLDPDIGAFQRTAAPALASGTITTATVSGQTITLAGTLANAASGTARLTGATQLGPVAINIAGSNWTVPDFTGAAAGTYTPELTLINAQGAQTVMMGSSLTIDDHTGSPEAPTPAEPVEPPVVSNVEGRPTSPTAATINFDTTRSGGTAWVVVTNSATKPSQTQVKAGQTNTGADAGAGRKLSQAVTTPGTREVSATNLTGAGTFYAHVFHEHPDGKSAVVSSLAFTQPAVIVAPAITDQPDSITVEDGADAVFNIAFTGTSPTVQARRDGANIPGAVVGAGTASLTLADCGIEDSGAEITFHLSNSAGSVASSPVVLTVNAPIAAPTITTDPVDDTAMEGESAAFSFEATNGGGTNAIQWFTRPSGNTGTGAAVPGATALLLTTAALALADNGREYRAEVTNETGTVYTRWARVTVSAVVLPPVITTQPQNVQRNPGHEATFTAAASGTGPFTIRWYFGGNVVTSAHNSTTMTTPPLSFADDGAEVYCTFENAAGIDTSGVAVVTVRDTIPPVVTVVVSTPDSSTVALTKFLTTEIGGLAYWMTMNGAAPTRDQVVASGNSTPVTSTSVEGLQSSGLIPGQTYSTYVAHVDAAGSPSNLVQSNTFVMPSVLPPGPGGKIVGISAAQLFHRLAVAANN